MRTESWPNADEVWQTATSYMLDHAENNRVATGHSSSEAFVSIRATRSTSHPICLNLNQQKKPGQYSSGVDTTFHAAVGKM